METAQRGRSWIAAPLALGAIQALAAAALVAFALATPPRRSAFRGLINDTNTTGAFRRLDLFRDALSWLPHVGNGMDLAPRSYVWGLRGTLIALALVQLAALLASLRAPAAPLSPWIVGPALSSLVLLAYPPLSADVFYYAISGHVANDGANPYLVPPRGFPDDPFLRFNDWRGITSPYGPLWTTVSRGIVSATGPDPVRAAVAFKIVAAVAALSLGLIAYLIARRIAGDQRIAVATFVLVAWQPALLLESAGTAHNDAVMMLLAVSGLWLLSRGTTRGGLVLIAASALMKYVTLPLLGFAALTRLVAREAGLLSLTRRWLLDLTAIALLTAFVFAPYWDGERTVESLIREPARLYVNPLWVLPRLEVVDRWGTGTGNDFRDATRTVAQWATIAVIAATALWLLLRSFRARRSADPCGDASMRRQVRAWAVTTAVLALLPVNAHAWYAVWAVAPVGLAWAASHQASQLATDRRRTALRRLPWWLWLYLIWSTVSFVVYHTRIIR